MTRADQLLGAAKHYRAAVNDRFAAEAAYRERRTEDRKHALQVAADAEEDATTNLLEVAGRVG